MAAVSKRKLKKLVCRGAAVFVLYWNLQNVLSITCAGWPVTIFPPSTAITTTRKTSSDTPLERAFNLELMASKQGTSNAGCKIPILKLSNPDIDPFIATVPPLDCGIGEPQWVVIKNAIFLIDQKAIEKHGDITCDCESIQRNTDYNFTLKKMKNYTSGSIVFGDFFVVNCKAKDKAKFTNVYATIKPLQNIVEKDQQKDKISPVNLNVYMIGFDSVSRMNWMRQLPKTYKFFVENLGGLVLEGYNIVGDGTPQALIPLFTGKTEEELPLTRKRYQNADFVDVYPFVWNDFKKAGYVTLFGEDSQKLATFQLRLKGFDKQPTDHYLRPFYLYLENHRSMPGLKSPFCLYNEPMHKVHFRYSEDLFRNYPRSVRKFAFNFHAALSHGDSKKSNINKVAVTDEDMLQHLKMFKNEKFLNDTILIMMADHGQRFQKIRETRQGKLEERLPFFGFSFPDSLKEKFPKAIENFKKNTKVLTTPFDIHATLKHLLDFRYPPKIGDLRERSISLFDEIPLERTCEHAGVAPHWCTCLEWHPFDVENYKIRKIVADIVAKINSETERERRLCSPINLHKIENALKYSTNDDLMKYQKSKDFDGYVPQFNDNFKKSIENYQVTFRTMPGNALYEASVVWKLGKNETIFNLNDVSHINRYGDLPHCVIDKDYFLAKWCVCYDKI